MGSSLVVVGSPVGVLSHQISNFGEADAADSGLLIISNSIFTGNIAKDYGGAVFASGQGSIEIHNSTFYSNEAFGMSLDRRSGSGGAIYAAPGTQVEVRSRGVGKK